jgi:hypothetical protein
MTITITARRQNMEKQELARKAIDRNRRLLDSNNALLFNAKALNDITVQNICVLHAQLLAMARKICIRLESFHCWSVYINKTLSQMLRDLNHHNFFHINEIQQSTLQDIRCRWRECISANQLYWIDEELDVRDRIHKEKLKLSVLREYVQFPGPASVLCDLQKFATAIPTLIESVDHDEQSQRTNSGPAIDDHLPLSGDDPEKDRVIDVTHTRHAVIDLSEQQRVYCDSEQTCGMPWFQAVKKRRILSNKPFLANNPMEAMPGFINGWNLLSRDNPTT